MKNTRTHKVLMLLFLITVVLPTVFLILVGTFFYHKKPANFTDEISFGVTFSHIFATDLKLNWQKVYLEMLDDLNPEFLRLPVYWSEIEKKEGELDFSDYDFMVTEADKREVKLTLVVGTKVPRWPECHVPLWAKELSETERQRSLMMAVGKTVERYEGVPSLYAWQVENEPFLPFFGECPPINSQNLDSEIALVKILDKGVHPIIVTDSGELSIWLPAAKRADIFGTTMYRIVWSRNFSKYLGYIKYPITPKFFWLKANLVEFFYPDKKIIVSELQAEPWANEGLEKLSREEQGKTMNIEKFKDNIEFVKDVGFSEAYLWGVEWWYWMREKNDNPEYWQVAKEVFSENRF